MKRLLLAHGLIFNLLWITCVLLNKPAAGGLILLLWCLVIRPTRNELVFMVTIGLTGALIDTLFTQLGWMAFKQSALTQDLFGEATLPPLWLWCLWLGFARFTYQWLASTEFGLTKNCLIFATAAVINYAAGGNMGAATIHWHEWQTTLLFVLWWLGFMPLCRCLYNHQCDGGQSWFASRQ